jgi:hypothetical protein
MGHRRGQQQQQQQQQQKRKRQRHKDSYYSGSKTRVGRNRRVFRLPSLLPISSQLWVVCWDEREALEVFMQTDTVTSGLWGA